MRKPNRKAGTSEASPRQRKAKPRRKITKARPESARREVFAREYVVDHNGQQAAIRAGYSPKSAKVTASRLLTDANVQSLIKKLDEKANDAAFLRAEDVKRSLAQALRFDPRKLYNEDGSLKSVSELDDDTAMALAGLEVVEMAGGRAVNGKEGAQHVPMYTKKVKWLDKNAAREQALNHFGLYERENKQKGDAIADLLNAINGHGRLEPKV